MHLSSQRPMMCGQLPVNLVLALALAVERWVGDDYQIVATWRSGRSKFFLCLENWEGQRQVLACFLTNPHYGSLINADGHAEVWTDWNNMSKFSQYGWRCSTNEDAYSNRTLMGNWNQERYDLKNIVQPKPLPSQFGHYFETTYDTSYNNRRPLSTHRFKREPHWFPGHQPELVPPPYKCTEKSTYMSSYSKPQTDHHSVCVWNPSNCRFQSP